jgi:hypothetical protein
MKTFQTIVLLTLLSANLHSEVFTGEKLITEFTIHGRLHYYNGGGEMRIWIVGSTRMLSVIEGGEECKKLNTIFSDGDGYFSRTIYGDFTVEPTEPDIKGHMRHVRIVKVRNVVIERDKDWKLLVIRKEL